MSDVDDRGIWTSASNAQADKLCPGRHLAQRNLADQAPSRDAEHGRLIHAALETGDVSKLSADQKDIYQSCEDIAAQCVQAWFESPDKVLMIVKERRFWATMGALVDGRTTEIKHSGRVDRAYVGSDTALIVEFKTLAGEVAEAASNEQLRDQAVLLWGGSAAPDGKGGFIRKLNRIATSVIQPLVTHKPELCIYEYQDLIRAETDLYARVRASNDPASKRIAGEIQCKFCRAKQQCPEYGQLIGSMLPTTVKVPFDVPVANWTGPQCATFLEGRALLQSWMDDAYEAIKTRLMANAGENGVPFEVPGFKLRDGATQRKIDRPQLVFDRFALLPGGTEDNFERRLAQFMACIDVGLTRLKNAVAEVTGFKGQRLEATVDKMLDGTVRTSKNKPSIVKEAKR